MEVPYRRIDPHVHCRDEKQSYKSTIGAVVALARQQNIAAVFDMPNCDPPVISKERVEQRLKLARDQRCLPEYYLFIGATADEEQLKEAIEVVQSNPRVIGIKMYAGHSVGDLAIVNEKEQKAVYEFLAQEKYDSVLAVHCEKESLMQPDLWNPAEPASWNLARPPDAELMSINDQIKFATASRYRGHLHVCHITTPGGVELVWNAKNKIRASCAATPHHLTYSIEDMHGREGLMLKVNPPIREREDMLLLRDALKKGRIDWIETDHAPHTREEKLNPPYMSGIRSLDNYAQFLEALKKEGVEDNEIYEWTNGSIMRAFGLKRI